jgi:type III secretion protein Q
MSYSEHGKHAFTAPADASFAIAERTLAYDFPVLTSKSVAAANACYGRVARLGAHDGNLELCLAFQRRKQPAKDEPQYSLAFSLAGQSSQLIAPCVFIQRLVASYGIDVDKVGTRSLLLLLEHRLTGPLTLLESRIGGPILLHDLKRVGREGEPEESVHLDARCQLGRERHWIAIQLTHPLAECLGHWLKAQARLSTQISVAPTLALRAGYAHLTFGELLTLRLNDVVLLENAAPSEMLAVYGERYGAWTRLSDARVSLVGPLFALSQNLGKVWSMGDSTHESVDNQPLDGAYEDVLVKLIFEVGRMDVELRTIKGLAEGQVIDLGRDPGTVVDIIAGSRRIGRGDLVRIGESLGVRITRLFSHE